MIELAITIKDEHTTLTERHPIYDPILLAHASPELTKMVEEAIKKFTGDKSSPDIIIKAKMTW